MGDIADYIAGLEQALAEAHKNLDTASIARLLHPDYVNLRNDGSRETRAEFLTSLDSGGRIWRTAQSDNLQVKVFGNCAVVTGRWRGVGTNRGKNFDYSASYLSIWVQSDGSWRNVAYSAHDIQTD
jgi:ketosteroid isomerase-like protein